ncbi:hypothetical protein PybrP1_008164 [[Pythium] brassicae (nom. inval.)]|nr:hypothetical protein PybrP1_008164 [[Pythium] brassicae (nom. inval.)]
MPRRVKGTTAAAVEEDADTAQSAEMNPDEANRRASLASRLEDLAHHDALAQAVKEARPEVDACRSVLLKPRGRRSLDEIYSLKSLLMASRLLDFFSNLDARTMRVVVRSRRELRVRSGLTRACISLLLYGCLMVIADKGDPGDKFYLVFTGQVEIVRHDAAGVEPDPTDNLMRLALLNSGDTFGERALLSETDMRTASAVIASDRAELVFISRDLFKELLREAQDAEAGSNTLEKRFRTNKDIIRNIFVRHSAQRSEKDLKFAVEYLKSVKFFSRFSFEVRKQLCKAMRLISAVTTTVLFEEGQIGRHFYIIFSGTVEVSVRSKDRFGEASENVVSRLGEGEYFGELALSEADGIRRATVVCANYCELLVLSRDQYEPLIKKYQNEYHAQYAHLLRKNAYFIGPEWDDNTIEGMCSVMTEKYVPFRGEICKQGSRATEMFIVTRGECRMTHEGKHPVTNEPQVYELGRFGPNSIIGCAEASAGKFNDIFVRDYSVSAESPVKILVLSRFDIFHLMSPEARESLQRSEAGFVRESIESRALKTVAWERYRRKFVEDIIASKRGASGMIQSGRVASRMTKSTSTPVLPTERAPKKLRRHSDSLLSPTGDADAQSSQPDNSTATTATLEISRRRLTVPGMAAALLSLPDKLAPSTSPTNNKPEHSESGSFDATLALHSGLQATSERRRRSAVSVPPSSKLSRSRTLAVLTPIEGSLAPLLPDRPLHDPSIVSGRVNHRASTRTLKPERAADALSPVQAKGSAAAAAACVSTIWSPVHGVCQPFSLLGFTKEKVAPKRASASSRARKALLGSASAHDASDSATTEPCASQFETCVTAFRVFGKFRDLNEALRVFRLVCGAEQVRPPPAGKDTGAFAVYKEDEITMVLENFFSEAAASATASRQFHAGDLLHGNGQRFACVSVLVALPAATAVESVAVHVYQCFPTLQSATRFAKQMAAAAVPAAAPLLIVPLFEWVPIADVERFDAKSADLEQALEAVADAGAGGYHSTWKARKDAAKKARALQPLRGSNA